jgi:hypothetical protein
MGRSGHCKFKTPSRHLFGETEESQEGSQNIWSQDQYLKPRPPDYQSGVLTTWQQYSVPRPRMREVYLQSPYAPW